MASLPPSLRNTLTYFDKYDYPLTKEELKYWASIPLPLNPSPRLGEGRKGEVQKKQEFYFLPGRQNLVKLRKQREKFSQAKWLIAKRIGEKLKKFPSITAIFVTGALAMNNCPANDDIDLMIVTYPHTLWFTRFFVDLHLKIANLRRSPPRRYTLDANYSNKICDNLWLDTKNLRLKTKNLYVAHEILQAKVLWDRAGVHNQFLTQNSWVKKNLPVAYKNLSLGPSPKFRRGKPQQGEVFLKFLNSIFFMIQYLYMKPKMTSEKVGPGFAFFHPNRH